MPVANKLLDERQTFADGHFLHIRIWQVPQPVPPSPHRFKYSLFYGRRGERVVLYDNERGKGDHKHYRDEEQAYDFWDVETLVGDFLADVRRERTL